LPNPDADRNLRGGGYLRLYSAYLRKRINHARGRYA
jgi:hypothetical protein